MITNVVHISRSQKKKIFSNLKKTSGLYELPIRRSFAMLGNRGKRPEKTTCQKFLWKLDCENFFSKEDLPNFFVFHFCNQKQNVEINHLLFGSLPKVCSNQFNLHQNIKIRKNYFWIVAFGSLTIKLIQVSTSFTHSTGIDYDQYSNTLLLSSYYSNGIPHNFEM